LSGLDEGIATRRFGAATVRASGLDAPEIGVGNSDGSRGKYEVSRRSRDVPAGIGKRVF
jgi:hypothetical protein